MPVAVVSAFLYLGFMWGSTYLFIKIGLDYWPPLLLASARNLLASLVTVAVMLILRRPWPGSGRAWWPPIVFGATTGVAFALIFWGQRYIPIGQASVLVATTPLFTMGFAWWWLGERVTWLNAAAAALGFTGVVLATGAREGAGFTGSEEQRLFGQMAMLGAALSYGVAYTFGKKYFRADLYANTAVHLGSAGLFLLVLSLLFDPPAPGAVLSWPAMGSLFYLAIPGSALAYVCLFYLMQHLNALQMVYATLLNPVVALFLGVAFFGEELRVTAVLGTTLVLAGAWLVNRSRG